MNSRQIASFFESFPKFGATSDLKRVKRMLDLLGNPEKNMKYIHVTGTNGKGSVCATLSSILSLTQYKTGLFTSPHLWKYNERIQIQGIDISDEELSNCIQKIQTILPEMTQGNLEMGPAQFEVLVVLALWHFAEQNVEIAVIEVGIGGKHDSTNVLTGIVSIITNVGQDHCALLGNTRAEIAMEKSGIIKPNAPVITGERDPQTQNIISQEALKNNAPCIILDPDDIHPLSQDQEGQRFHFKNYSQLFTPLFGKHQLENMALAILATEELQQQGFCISSEDIRNGVARAKWPLRLEIVRMHPYILIDVGHNPDGVLVANEFVHKFFRNNKKILILGCSYDKPWEQMSQILSQGVDVVIVTTAKHKGRNPQEIYDLLRTTKHEIYLTRTIHEALEKAKDVASNPEDVILILGGLFLGAEAYSLLPNVFPN